MHQRHKHSFPSKLLSTTVISFLMAVGLWLLANEASSGPSQLRSRTVTLKSPPTWVVSGVWRQDSSSEFLLIDTLKSRLVRYSLKGDNLGHIEGIDNTMISLISPYAKGYLVEDEDGKFIWLNSKLKRGITTNLLAESSNGHFALGSVYAWAPATDGFIYAYGDIKKTTKDNEEDWSSALVRISLKDPENSSIVHEIAINNPARNFYLLGIPYIATIGDKGYFLVMEEQPFVIEVTPSSTGWSKRRMDSLEDVFEKRPVLPDKKGLASAAAIFKVLEKSSMPSGLYGWQGSLCVVLRKPGAERDNSTEWSVVKVYPGTGQIKDKIAYVRSIPSSANHLTVIPGPERWLILQKGPVLGLGRQDVKSALVIEASALK